MSRWHSNSSIQQGKPFAGRAVTVIRPEGPFAATWPPNPPDGRRRTDYLSQSRSRVAHCDRRGRQRPSHIHGSRGFSEPGSAVDRPGPAPGEPVALEFVDPEGKPFADRAVTVIRPEGPFAATWPPILRTDAAGRIIFRSLEAGSHTAIVEDARDRATFTVREASTDNASTPPKKTTLRRAGP